MYLFFNFSEQNIYSVKIPLNQILMLLLIFLLCSPHDQDLTLSLPYSLFLLSLSLYLPPLHQTQPDHLNMLFSISSLFYRTLFSSTSSDPFLLSCRFQLRPAFRWEVLPVPLQPFASQPHPRSRQVLLSTPIALTVFAEVSGPTRRL